MGDCGVCSPEPRVQVYAVVRYDTYKTGVASGLSLFTVKEIVHDPVIARRRVGRTRRHRSLEKLHFESRRDAPLDHPAP